MGGTAGSTVYKNLPTPYIGKVVHKNTQLTQQFGDFDIIYRAIYSNDYSNFSNTYAYGNVVFSETTADFTLNGTDYNNLTLEFNDATGIFHIYGAMGTEYIDFYYPQGAKKAIYIHTNSAGVIDTLGEAYITN